MAQVEPMDIDAIENDFDNKENAFHYNNVLPRTPCTEKGYEELDVSELNMKLRYSITPESSPMSKSLTGPCLDNRNCNPEDYLSAVADENGNGNLTRSLNSTLTKMETLSKSKLLPLQTLSADPFVETNRSSSIHRLLSTTNNNVIISVNNANDLDENLSLPSTCSSVPDTPEATTPTKEIPKPEGSPIMRGLKSVLSMFRPSQSPILLADDKSKKFEIVSSIELNKSEVETVQVSTPVAVNKQSDANSTKRNSPLKESLVFNDDLERELLWKDETTVIFKEERIPVHKLFFQNPITEISLVPKSTTTTVEHMDISCDEAIKVDRTNTNTELSDKSDKHEHPTTVESDNEFLDCETTFTKHESYASDYNKLGIDNEIKITGNTTADLSNNANISTNINTECKNVSENTGCATPRDINICTNQASLSFTNFIPKIDRNDTNIIEATINLLNSEINDSSKKAVNHNIGLQNKSGAGEKFQLKDQNITASAAEEVIKNNVIINATEAKASATFNIKNDITTVMNLKGEEISESESQARFMGNLSDVCTKSLNNNNNLRDESTDTSHTVETEGESKIIDDMSVTVKNINIVIDNFSSGNRAIIIEGIDTIGNEPDIDKSNMTNSLANTPELESNIDLLPSSKDITMDADIETLIINKTFVGAVNNSNNIEGILNKDNKIIEEISVTQVTKEGIGVPRQVDSEMLADDNNVNGVASNFINVKDILDFDEGMSVTETTKCNEFIPIKIALTPPVKDLINTNSSLELKFGINDELNGDKVDFKSILPKVDIANEINNDDIEGIVGNKKESFSLQMKLGETVESKKDDYMKTSYVIANTVSLVNNLSDNDRQVSEPIIGSDIVVSKSPSEVPLPDEDDIEKSISGDNGIYKEDFNNQDITRPYIINSINEKNTEITDNKVPVYNEEDNAQTQSAYVHMTEVETIAVNTENLEQGMTICDLQLTKDNILCEEISSKNMKQNASLEISGNTENNIVETEVCNNTKENFSDVVNIEKHDNANGLNKSEAVGVVKQEDFIPVKRVDEIDEEIITSANNSPYVSVTDLDIVAEKMLKDPLEEIDNAIITNAEFASPPPTSPKIVSKGYNFNFDEMDDPFASKTKIRLSPTPDTANECLATATTQMKTLQEVPKKGNRRKSQPERKRPVQKKGINCTFSDKMASKEPSSEKHMSSAINTTKDNVLGISTSPVKENVLEHKFENCVSTIVENDEINQKVEDCSKLVTSSNKVSTSVRKDETQCNDEEIKNIEQTLVISTDKSTSSSEQYFSLGTSSGESTGLMNRSKNVFNLPEIDDVNFNPFVTKSKMRMSPTPTEKPVSSVDNPTDVLKLSFVPQQQSDENAIKQLDTKVTCNKKITNDSSSNVNNTTCYSKNTNDVDSTVTEILTEDEDTIEGPFLEIDDLRDAPKVTDVDIETDMMNFEEIPQQERDENLENGELFIDADAFEFLLNQNKSTTVTDSGKESLFLKFDPLFTKRVSSDGIIAALSKVQKRQSTPKKVTKPTHKDFTPIEKSTAGPSNNNENCNRMEEYNEDLSSTVAKPMMVVNPAVSSIIAQKKSATPKLNRRSLTFTSPAMAVIDRLLSLSGNSSHLEQDASIPQIGREHSETDLAITQLRELLAEKEINVHGLRSEGKELKDRLAALEGQVRGLEAESAERLSKINELNERLLEKTKMNKSMAIVVEEYERTIASLIAETEQDKKRNAEERMRLIKERDEQTAHLTSMEVSFSDLHSKYEKSKQIILSCKANDDIYKKSIKEFQDNFSKMQNNYELLKQHATSKLNHANQELEKMNRAHEAEVLKMNAMIKRKELHITSLEETLAQKTKANEELTAICDELINKVG